MALPLIAAVRQRRDLKESVLHTVQELAHRASIYGVVRDSNAYMARKCHCSKRTFQRHVLQLIALRIVKKTVTKTLVKVRVGDRVETRLRNEINVYTFTMAWQHPDRTHVPIVTMTRKFPYLQDRDKSATLQEQEKGGSFAEKIAALEKGLRFCTAGSEAYQSTEERLARLRALQHPETEPAATDLVGTAR